MNRFINTTAALFKKDLKDILKNPSVSIMLLLPPLFALIFTWLFTDMLGEELAGSFGRSYVLFLTTVMCTSLVPLSFLATIIAEEKEKNTLRTLMLAGVSPFEFLTSKMLATWLLMEVVNVLDLLIVGNPASDIPMFLLITTIGSISLLFIGTVIGMLSRDQMSTSILSVPVMLILMFPSMLSQISGLFARIAVFSPIEHMMRLYNLWAGGEPVFSSGGLTSVGVIAIWIALGVALYLLAYKKRRLDG